MNAHEITKRGSRSNYSMLTTPAGGWKKGQAFQEGATPDSAVLADGTAPIIGFATRDGVVGGPDISWEVWGKSRLASPDVAGGEASFEDAEEFEAEGSDHVIGSGSNMIDANTALQTRLAFEDGKVCAAASAKLSEFALVAIKDAEVAANGKRFVCRRIHGGVVA